MDGNYDMKNVVYPAYIFPKENNLDEKAYIGLFSLKWKFSYYNHKHFFNNPLLRNQTVLSKYYWKLKDQRLSPIIK